jgi:hypothetical protein
MRTLLLDFALRECRILRANAFDQCDFNLKSNRAFALAEWNLVASGLQANGDQVFAPQHTRRHIFIHDFWSVSESFVDQSVVSG